MQNLVILSGAGISAESGIATFRDSNGLWENHSIEEVASPMGWAKNPELVLDFYNKRRKQLKEVTPNAAHLFLADLEKNFNVNIITQNVDDLHERAGNSNVLHLHGELKKVRSVEDENLVYDWDGDLNLGDLAEDGSQLRPHIVWFGESVPLYEEAADICSKADVLLIIGTSLQVYPAANLFEYTAESTPIVVINPIKTEIFTKRKIQFIENTAVNSIPELSKILLNIKKKRGFSPLIFRKLPLF